MKGIVAVSVALVLTGCSSPEEKEAAACNNTTTAFVMSQNFVKQRLKSPSTASFPYINDAGVKAVQVTPFEECKHSISAYVDAQNGFGGTVRNRYTVVMQKAAGKNLWYARDLVIF